MKKVISLNLLLSSFVVGSLAFILWHYNYVSRLNFTLNGVCSSVAPYIQIGSSRWARELAEGSFHSSHPELNLRFDGSPIAILASRECTARGIQEVFLIQVEATERYKKIMLLRFALSIGLAFGALLLISIGFNIYSQRLSEELAQALMLRLGIHVESVNRGSRITRWILNRLPGIDQLSSTVTNLNSSLDREINRSAGLHSALMHRRTFAKYLHDIRSPVGALQIILQKNQSKFSVDEVAMLDQVLTRLKTIPDLVLNVEKGAAATSRKETALQDFISILRLTIDRLNLEFEDKCIVDLRGYDADIGSEKFLKLSASDLDRLVTNICTNARAVGAGKVSIACNVLGDTLAITFADNGPGGLENKIASKARLGLGLEIVRDLVDKSNGKLDVSSPLGKGTEITVCMQIYTYSVGSQADKS